MKKYSIKYILSNKNIYKKLINKIIIIQGWIKYYRNNIFIDINDGTSIKNLQVLIKDKKFLSIKKKINIGIPIKVIGILVYQKKNKNKIELIPNKIKIYKGYDLNYINNSILQNKYHKLSKLREEIYLRFRTNIFSTIIRIRSILFFEIHKFFYKNKYIYINTPIINKNNAEGAGEVFNITSLDSNNKNLKDLFNNEGKLTVSGQLELESSMYGLGKVYTFGPVFRAENSNTYKHLSEFWMLESEIMYYKLKDIINLAIKLIKYLLKKILIKCKDELFYLDQYHKKHNKFKDLNNRLKKIINNKFIKISYTNIIKLLKKEDNDIIKWGEDIGSIHEKIIFNNIFKKSLPIIIYNFPNKIKPFYMKRNKYNNTTKSIDILLPGVGEIIGGSERETSYKKLLKRIKKNKMNVKNINWYLNLRKLGKIYHSGFGLGVDRLIQFITGINNIRDVVPFPIYPGHI
ncbi:MAG: asparagine--tRNA ligase [Candidatus Shikimatogenerans bostrichidophilus]|nr:MAG: asparagine--tRNA ligase [Candidatus Shikimatogenerans bostrichidophilus]